MRSTPGFQLNGKSWQDTVATMENGYIYSGIWASRMGPRILWFYAVSLIKLRLQTSKFFFTENLFFTPFYTKLCQPPLCKSKVCKVSGNTKGGSITVHVDLLFDWFGISCMTTDNFCFYLQNRLIQTSQTGGQQYIYTFPFSIP
jgi:hypothetical protein